MGLVWASVIDVVGIGDDGWAGLDEGRRGLLRDASTVLGGRRHLDLVAGHTATGARLVPWPSPLRPALPGLLEGKGDAVVLASGDPLRSGIGTTLIELFGRDRVRIHPAVASDVLARARQGWSAEETTVVTTVGRDPRALLPHLAPGARLVVLCSGGDDPAVLGGLLTENGWGATELTARWHLGGPGEGARAARADAFTGRTEDLVVCCLEVRSDTPAVTAAAGPVPGRSEDFIDHDGQLTKRDVRASALARLRPTPGGHLWDLGAGNGSVALEWCLGAERATATCVERDPDRAQRIRDNADALGLGGRVDVVLGDTATTDLADLAVADAVFVGGGLDGDLLDRAWSSLRPGDRLVAHAVTLEGEAALVALHTRTGGELTRLTVERAVPLGRFLSWTPARAVTQLAATQTHGDP